MQLRECCFFFQLSEWTSYSCMTVESVVNLWSVSPKATVWIISCEEKWIWNLKYWCFVIMGKLHWCDDWLYSPFILMRFLSWELQKKKRGNFCQVRIPKMRVTDCRKYYFLFLSNVVSMTFVCFCIHGIRLSGGQWGQKATDLSMHVITHRWGRPSDH